MADLKVKIEEASSVEKDAFITRWSGVVLRA
jgi:hypothetical protein